MRSTTARNVRHGRGRSAADGGLESGEDGVDADCVDGSVDPADVPDERGESYGVLGEGGGVGVEQVPGGAGPVTGGVGPARLPPGAGPGVDAVPVLRAVECPVAAGVLEQGGVGELVAQSARGTDRLQAAGSVLGEQLLDVPGVDLSSWLLGLERGQVGDGERAGGGGEQPQHVAGEAAAGDEGVDLGCAEVAQVLPAGEADELDGGGVVERVASVRGHIGRQLGVGSAGHVDVGVVGDEVGEQAGDAGGAGWVEVLVEAVHDQQQVPARSDARAAARSHSDR